MLDWHSLQICYPLDIKLLLLLLLYEHFYKVSASLPLWLLRRCFFFIYFVFQNLTFLLPWQPIKIHIFGSGLLKEHFCKTFVKLSAVR